MTPVPVRLCLSGPAAGVAAAARLACSHGLDLVATFDVGGTSTDVAVLRGGEVPFTPAREIDGLPLRTPMVDMDVIGAGGGSLARVDEAGGLTVGPDSAGADPGPVAFGRGGTMPTLTDALLVLGRLDPAGLLGGRVPVDVAAAAAALEVAIARPLGLDVQRAALGVVRVAVAAMVRCLRAQAVRRGLDLRGAWLVAYGGAGPTLAAEVLREARMAGFLVPPEPGIFCAAALLGGEVAADHSATLLAAVDDDAWPRVVAAHQRLRDAADAWLAGEGVPAAARSFPLTLELRFRGQGHDLAVGFADGRLPPPAEVLAALAAAHARALGTTVEGRAAELTVLRVRAVGRLATAAPHPRPTPLQLHPHRRVGLPGGRETVAVLDRAALVPGTQRPGACIVQELTSTTLVLPGQRLRVAADGALMVQEMRDG
ncbi:MAG: hypothetical protein EA356_01865 [Geminicoccaceae bacterium]|nr:MAG: hypothetical protein EA356_01865 [Geminicoccaceae bacterium]